MIFMLTLLFKYDTTITTTTTTTTTNTATTTTTTTMATPVKSWYTLPP